MSSEINSVDGGGPTAVGTGRVAQRTPAAGSAAPSAGSAESVHITDAASQLAQLEQSARDLPAIDETRVAAVSSALDQGTYTISPDGIASNLIQLEQSLGAIGQS